MSFFTSRRQSETAPPSIEERSQLPKLAAPQQPVGFETVLGANCTLEGVLRSKANVRLDGTFSGTLEIEGNVLVGETAKITADINAKNISIAGAVRGNVNGKKVQILRTGRVWGDIHATALTTEEGAFIDGKIAMISHEAANSPAETSEASAVETIPELVDELQPIIEEAQERGLSEQDVLAESNMAAEGGITIAEDTQPN
jgi:cytoskeletal protein CcmA (bactofilin family)